MLDARPARRNSRRCPFYQRARLHSIIVGHGEGIAVQLGVSAAFGTGRHESQAAPTSTHTRAGTRHGWLGDGRNLTTR